MREGGQDSPTHLDDQGAGAVEKLVIDEGVTSVDGFYDELARLLKLEDWFGRNLNAFNDVLRGGCGQVDPRGKVFVWKGSGAARAAIGERTWSTIMEIFQDADNSGHEAFVVQLE